MTASQRTKHVDLRTKFITQYIEEKFIKIEFVRSEENVSDILTKNVTGDTFDRHVEAFVAPADFVDMET